jgi:ribosomal protein L40E
MVMGSDIDQLQALACVKCGATLPAEAATGEMVTCGYCGTAFKLPTAQTRRGGD